MHLFQALAVLLLLYKPLSYGKIPCDPESFNFIDSPRHTEAFGVYTFRISNLEEIGCAVNVTYDWILYRKDGSELVKIPEETKALRIPGRSKSMINQVNFDNIPLVEDGLPKVFALKVILIPDPTHYPSYRVWIFGPDVDEPVDDVTISGGKERTHWLDGTSLWLNATGTEGDAILADLSNPSWKCSPPFRGLTPPNTFKWEIPEHYLTENMTHQCTLTVDLPYGQTKSVTQIIHIRSLSHMHQIEIRCRRNCDEPANANEETSLQLYCHDNCQTFKDQQPTWSVRPYAENYLKASTTWGIGENPTGITFKGNTFKPGSTMDFIADAGEITANYTIHFAMQKPKIEVRCIENCENFDSRLTTKFQVICSSDCNNLNYDWECRPFPAKPWILNPPKNDIITFSPNTFSKDTSVYLRVLSGRSQVTYDFKTGSGSATLQIRCHSNCETFDPRLPLELKAECLNNCIGQQDYSYRWTVSVPRPGFHWYDHTLDGNRTLIIPANTFRDADLVDFWVYGDSGNNSAIITFHVEKAQLKIECVENCATDDSHPNPHKPVKLKVACSAECKYGPYSWRLEPPPGLLNYTSQVSEGGTFFTIPPEQYKEGSSLQLTVTKGTGSASFTLNFKDLKPELEIRCLKNCIAPLDPMKDTVLEADCLKFCDGISLEWRPVPKPDLWHDHFELGKHNRTLIIKGGTYKNSESVDFGVFAKNNAEAHLALNYKPPAPKLLIKCLENCNTSWVSFKTVLKINCVENCQNLAFEWHIKPEPDALKWAKHIEMSKDNASLTVLPFAFKHGEKITFGVKSRLQASTRTLDLIQQRQAEQEAQLSIDFEEIPAEIKIDCEPMGCNRTANRLKSVLLTVNCIKNCNNTAYVWEIIPLPSGFVWDVNTIRGIENKTLKILPNTCKDGDNITVVVYSGAGKASVFIVFKDPISEFIVVCDDNCNPSNPHKPVALRIKCIMLCEHIDIYEWEFIPSANSVYGPKMQTVKFLGGTFKDGDVVTATAKSGLSNSTLKLAFVAPPPVLEIVCFRNCEFNPKADTFFKIRCIVGCYEGMKYDWTLTPAPKKKEVYFHKNFIISLPEHSYENNTVNLTVVSGKAHTTKLFVFKEIKTSHSPDFECDSLHCDGLEARRMFIEAKNALSKSGRIILFTLYLAILPIFALIFVQ